MILDLYDSAQERTKKMWITLQLHKAMRPALISV